MFTCSERSVSNLLTHSFNSHAQVARHRPHLSDHQIKAAIHGVHPALAGQVRPADPVRPARGLPRPPQATLRTHETRGHTQGIHRAITVTKGVSYHTQ